MISIEEVKRVARLACLKLTDEEVQDYKEDLNRILVAADRIKEVDTEGINPTAHAVPLENVFRPDTIEEGLSQESVLKNGPHIVNGFFRVPRILDDGEDS